jgi:hypothetical protein
MIKELENYHQGPLFVVLGGAKPGIYLKPPRFGPGTIGRHSPPFPIVIYCENRQEAISVASLQALISHFMTSSIDDIASHLQTSPAVGKCLPTVSTHYALVVGAVPGIYRQV